jgi:hypothetical protein
MNVALAIAALGCLVLALGHTTIGLRWVLPNLTKGSLPSTPFGSPSMTLGMVRFTWHVLSVLLLGFGILLMVLAWAPGADPKTLLLRWCVPSSGLLLRRLPAGTRAAVLPASCVFRCRWSSW